MKSRGPIVIIGFMACGKTEVARLLAERIKAVVVDLDELITSIEGRSPAEIIREAGERAFRKIESAVLEDLLHKKEASVIALGGGAWIETANRELLAQNEATSVWLDTPFDLCWERIEASTEDRPLGTTRGQASELFRQRGPIYELAQIRIEVTTEDSPEQIAEMVESKLTQESF